MKRRRGEEVDRNISHSSSARKLPVPWISRNQTRSKICLIIILRSQSKFNKTFILLDCALDLKFWRCCRESAVIPETSSISGRIAFLSASNMIGLERFLSILTICLIGVERNRCLGGDMMDDACSASKHNTFG